MTRSRAVLRFSVLLLAAACCLAAQSKRPEDLAIGKILVSQRDAPDPAFAESVIMLVRYGETGVVGLMVNRRTTVPISRALQEVKGAAGHADPVFVGGPVGLDTVLTLARAPGKPEGATEIVGDVSLITARPALEKALGGTGPIEIRVFLGYCGWTRRQLENEVRLGAWYIFDRSENLAFDAAPAMLWSNLIARAELQIALLGFALQAR